MDGETSLALLHEDFDTALAPVAHPDDVEFGNAASIARWTKQGKRIDYCMVTSGEAGIDSMPPEQCGPLREAEQRESERIVGVDTVDFLGFADGVVTYGLELRRAIAHEIRLRRPELIITGNFREDFGGQMPNQADHVATGRAIIDGAGDAGNRWIFPISLSTVWSRGVECVRFGPPAHREPSMVSMSPTPFNRALTLSKLIGSTLMDSDRMISPQQRC